MGIKGNSASYEYVTIKIKRLSFSSEKEVLKMEIVIDIVMNELEAVLSFICTPVAFVIGKLLLKRMQYKMRKGV